jgi:hypothetical protein
MTEPMMWGIIWTAALLSGCLVGHLIARNWGKPR